MKEKVLKIADKVRLLNLSTSEPVKCKKCTDSGFIANEDGTFSKCECLREKDDRARMEGLFRDARIPARYRGKTLDNFDKAYQPNAHRIACEYATTWPKPEGESLFFVGPVGTGKSHLARAILTEMIGRHKISGVAVTVPSLMDDLRPGADEGLRAERIDVLKTVPLLVLDDLGAQRTTEWVTERLFVIVNARYDEMLPTIITSNVYLEDLCKLPGWDRLVDRIVEMARRVRLDGASYRTRGRLR